MRSYAKRVAVEQVTRHHRGDMKAIGGTESDADAPIVGSDAIATRRAPTNEAATILSTNGVAADEDNRAWLLQYLDGARQDMWQSEWVRNVSIVLVTLALAVALCAPWWPFVIAPALLVAVGELLVICHSSAAVRALRHLLYLGQLDLAGGLVLDGSGQVLRYRLFWLLVRDHQSGTHYHLLRRLAIRSSVSAGNAVRFRAAVRTRLVVGLQREPGCPSAPHGGCSPKCSPDLPRLIEGGGNKTNQVTSRAFNRQREQETVHSLEHGSMKMPIMITCYSWDVNGSPITAPMLSVNWSRTDAVRKRRHRSLGIALLAVIMGNVTCIVASGQCHAQLIPTSEPTSTYHVLLDNSSSMTERPKNPTASSWARKIDEVKRQFAVFINSLPDCTEVQLYSFDKQLVKGPRIVVESEDGRRKLLDFVIALKANGTETRLWRSVDAVLAEASRVAADRPGMRVRVLAYSDGEDTETPPMRPGPVLEKYRQFLKESSVQLTYVTLGFELQADVKKALEQDGVQVRKAVVPDDIIPLQADFRILPIEPTVGSIVTLIDDSIGVIRDRTIDWGDGTAVSRGRSPTHSYAQVGEYAIRLNLASSTGQKSAATQNVRVVLPPGPVAAFNISATEIMTADSVLAVNESTGTNCRFEWSIDGSRISTDTHPRIPFLQAGQFTLKLTNSDSFGRTHMAERTVTVRGPHPPIAAVVGPEIADIGQKAKFFHRCTIGQVDQFVWLVDGNEAASTPDFTHEFTEPGRHTLWLRVNGPGGMSEAEHNVDIRGWGAPVAAFYAREVAIVGERVEFIDRSSGKIEARSWAIDGEVFSQDVDMDYRFPSAGDHIVRQEVRGPGGVGFTEQTICVSPIPSPVAEFVVGAPESRVDESVIFTDISEGGVDTATWYLPDRDPPITVDYRLGGSRSVEHSFARAGEQDIRLVVRGPGGEHEITRRISIKTRSMLPVGVVTVDRSRGRAPLLVAFRNQSSGSVVRTEYDFGDGSPVLSVSGVDDARHEYAPGSHTARVRMIGPEEFAPAFVEIAIEVVPPLPAWIRHLWWESPAGLGFIVASALALSFLRRSREQRRLSMLVGALNYKPAREPFAPYRTAQFRGTSQEERVGLTPSADAIVRATADPATGLIEHSIEVVDRNGRHDGPIALPPNDRITVGEFEFNLVQI